MNRSEIFQLKVTLKDSYPPIWRRFLVWDSVSFEFLHAILQKVIGWGDYHAYEFIVKRERIMNPEGAKPSPFHGKMTSTEDTFLCDRVKRVGQKFTYIYDFGDNWQHEILFEKRLPFDENQLLPFCLEGELACPPEDCGGIFRFLQLRDMLNTPPGDEKYPDGITPDLLEWIGDFDPESFDIDTVNRSLRPRRYNGKFDEEIVRDKLEFRFDSQRVDTFLREIGIHNTTENKEKLLQRIFSDEEFVLDTRKNRIYTKYYLLKQFKTRIQPGPLEIGKGILIPGNCFIPHFGKNFIIKWLDLLYHYKPMEIKEMTFEWQEVEGFFSLVNAGDTPIKNRMDIMHPDQEITFLVVDLKEFYERTYFKQGDSILLEPEDLYNHSFSLKYVSAAKMKKKQEKIQQSDRFFLEHLRKILKMDIPFISISHQILYALYGVFNTDFSTWDVPGSAFDKLISKADDIMISTLGNGRKLLHLKENEVINTGGV